MSALARFRRGESGASLIEYAIVISLFLLIFFAILDFGRLGFNWVMTEKAMQRAVRIAVTRPAICPGVPQTHVRGSNTSAAFGDRCGDGAGICGDPGTRSCVLSSTPVDCGTSAPSTGEEIWCIINPILPSNATPRNIRVTYA